MKSSLPKVLHPLAGKPILQYSLELAQKLGSLRTYIVAGYQSHLVEEFFTVNHRDLLKDCVFVKQKRLLGTADALLTVQKYFKNYHGDVLVLSGDVPLLKKESLSALVRKHQALQSACSVLTARVNDPQGYGRIIRDAGGKILAIREEKDAQGFECQINEINAGIYCFKSRELFRFLKKIPMNKKKKEFYLTDIIELFLRKNLGVGARETQEPGEALGINSRLDLAKAERVLREKILSDFMRKGVTIIDPQTTFIAANVRIGKDTVIYPFTFIEKDVAIGRDCTIGPFARLRPGTKIGDKVQIGNFTEVSRTRIGRGSLMKHFSFLGDAVVGKEVNIGAGAITANFDGSKKNKTHISDQAFIGSDSVLVAPVKIGKKAVVGAGSVVTKGKNVPGGSLVVGVPARVVARKNKRS